MLRTELQVQTAVYGQPVTVFDANGDALPEFARFCDMRAECSLPTVSPACESGDCPQPIESRSNNRNILIATPWAQDLFCVTADLIATGTLPVADGRVCFGDCDERADCDSGPVDCVAYGDFAGDNGIFGLPAPAAFPGEALVGDLARQGRFSPAFGAGAVCVGGDRANTSCTNDENRCGDGACIACPDGSCSNLLASAAGFFFDFPRPRNFADEEGEITGSPGDPDRSGIVDAKAVSATAAALFEGGRRCELERGRRGADANFDTRVGAADVVASVRIATTG
jgi:hypothetical protein